MELKDREKLEQMFQLYLNEQMSQMILSKAAFGQELTKVKIRPLLLRGQLQFQAEELVGKQAFHKNLSLDETKNYLLDLLENRFGQAELWSALGSAHVLVGKKGTVTVKMKKTPPVKMLTKPAVLSHNRSKRYILEEGKPVGFLIDLGVMTPDGTVVKSKYDKFKQINRFLELIEDILPRLNPEKTSTIIDFGCGKSYLTFAMYYYLHELKQYPIRIIGLDLKYEVITRCNRLSEQYGFEFLKFYHGDISSYEGVDQVDMVVTLHACDVATDYALAKAVRWGASVILSVPCCQHELNSQIKNPILAPVFQYGIIKERMAALYTDALRAEILENQGYRTQILEFIDMEHTPKNILIRAIKQGQPKDNESEIRTILEFLQAKPMLATLLLSSDSDN